MGFLIRGKSNKITGKIVKLSRNTLINPKRSAKFPPSKVPNDPTMKSCSYPSIWYTNI